MTAKQAQGQYAPDGSKYGTLTDGAGTLDVIPAPVASGSPKQAKGAQAPDGSIYFTLTDGAGTLK